MNDMSSDAERMVRDRADRPGTLLRRAREAKGMSIADVAEVTRIAQRQLEAIERSDFSSLPGTPYAVGFARAYARAVGIDEVEIARGVREELGAQEMGERYEAFEPIDPARIPPRSLAWIAAAVALILAVGYGVWRTQFFSASTQQEISDLTNRSDSQANSSAAAPSAAVPEPVTAGPVVLTATQDVWLRIYDQEGARLLEKQMAKGESFTVPPNANNPMILTGRPDALAVTVGGKSVAPLGPPEKTITDVPISAQALLARPAIPVAASSGAVSGAAAVPAPSSAPQPVTSVAPSQVPASGAASPDASPAG